MASNGKEFKYPGVRAAMDGNTAVIMCERESTDAAGAYPITPSTQMGEYWAEETAKGHINISDRPLIFIEPEGEHAAAAVTAGLAMTGLRSANFSSGQGIAYMHESLYAAVGKRLTYVLNMGCRAMTKATLNVHAGHDDYHCVDDTGFFQVFGKNVQEACDLNIIAHKIGELALTPGIVAQDGFLTTHLIESMLIPERELIEEYLGRPDDIIETPTPAQRILYGDTRRRIPAIWTVDDPVMTGIVQNQDSYMQSVAAQRPYFFDHIEAITEQCMKEFSELTGRHYDLVSEYRTEDADYLIVGQGSMIPTAEAVADYLRETRKIKVGVVNITMFRPFPGNRLAAILKKRKGVAILERLDQPLAEDLPLAREIRAAVAKCVENGSAGKKEQPFPGYDSYTSLSDVSPIYSGSYGMGSRDLQPEGLIAAIENMLSDGKRKKFFYLSIDFLREKALSPKQEIHQDTIREAYPHVGELALRGSENPNLIPKKSITVRFHSIGGWGAITTGKNLAMTLFDLLGYHVKANPKYGSEKKGQPTTYYLSASNEPIRVNCEYHQVDVVLSPDPNVFEHTNALAGLKEGGVFIIQSDQETPEAVWKSIPEPFRKIILDKNIRLFSINAFQIAREEASNPDLQLRMQGIAFQGSFFAASPVAEEAGLKEDELFRAIEDQLQQKFGSKGARIVEDNLRVVRRGFDEVVEVTEKSLDSTEGLSAEKGEPPLPVSLKHLPPSQSPTTDIHRFWEQTGSFYARGMGNDNITDPFIGLSMIPAATSVFRDMTGIRFEHPEWVPENCTGCGECWTVCPDTAIPGLVSDISAVSQTALKRIQANGTKVKHLRKSAFTFEKKLRALLQEASDNANVRDLMEKAIREAIEASGLEGEEKQELSKEYDLFRETVGDFQFALTAPFFRVSEKMEKNSGGLLSITVNTETCKGCMECIQVCDDDALKRVTQTHESVDRLRKNWDFWQDLPTTPEKFIRIDDLEEGVGALKSMLLNKECYQSLVSGDGACLGCGEKTVVHLFTATVEALMQPRVKKHLEHISSLITQLEKHMKSRLLDHMEVGDASAIETALGKLRDRDITLGDLATELNQGTNVEPIDPEWLEHVTSLMQELKDLQWKYTEGRTGRGRSKMGILNATGCSSVWASTYPFNPYPFPWSNNLFQDSPSVALGIFEGHMSQMAEGFKAIRKAELELSGKYDSSKHDEFFTYFNWEQFSDEEFHLCPPVVALGGDGAMYDIGFQNLSRALMSGKPIKVLVLDTQVYSNTGGQACTSGFPGQVSDMAQFGKAIKGKKEIRKEIALLGMAHRTSFILQSSIASGNHLIEGFIEGLVSRRPALFNVYTSCQPEHGIGDDLSARQAKLALESRAYPFFRFNPDRGETFEECIDIDGNPNLDQDWPTYTLTYEEGGAEKSMELPMTFADFAVTEGRFLKHFRMAPRDTWNDNMVPVHEFVQLDEEDRAGVFPFIWIVDRKNQLGRALVAKPIIDACEDRVNFWRILRSLSGVVTDEAVEASSQRVKTEMVQTLTSNLMQLAAGNGENGQTANAPQQGASK
jgi:pyruvate-ferredoxin/flavodoxin oxidoreductase